MYGQNIHNVEPIILLLLVCVVALATLAKRANTPYPIVLVIAGLFLSLIPRVPHIELNPDVVFLLFLPPLLFSAAYQTSWRDFRYNISSISLLALGLVSFTVYGVAVATHWIIPDFTWREGLVLGAVVCTTDAIAATSIARRLGLPGRLTDVIEGESLVNDASGLLALQITVSMVITGHTSTLHQRISLLFYLVATSVIIGLVISKLAALMIARIDDAPVEITISLITPYFAYLAAESVHSSGVLATVACGMYLGHQSSLLFSTRARLQSAAVWDTLSFVLNGIVFILIGLQLPYILSQIRDLSLGRLLLTGLLISAVVVILRLIWIYPGARAAHWIRWRIQHQNDPMPGWRQLFIAGWTGMRGVVALAAAISLPKVLADGSPFPQRNVIIFLTFCVIFVTLVFQGLSLPFFIRKLGLASANVENPEEQRARYAMIDAALAYLEAGRDSAATEFVPVYDELIRIQKHHLNLLPGPRHADTGYSAQEYELYRDLTRSIRALQRAALLNLRNQNKINDEVLRRLEQELDLFEIRYADSQ
ncbi:MAG TPA: Na+/H+ antiporter [Candidatus Acidoferrales bacterium]